MLRSIAVYILVVLLAMATAVHSLLAQAPVPAQHAYICAGLHNATMPTSTQTYAYGHDGCLQSRELARCRAAVQCTLTPQPRPLTQTALQLAARRDVIRQH